MQLEGWQGGWSSGREAVAASSSLQAQPLSICQGRPRWQELQQQFLGKQPRAPMEHVETALKQGMERAKLGLYRALSWMSHTRLSLLHLPLWLSPALLSLPHSVEQLPVFMGQFHLLLIQFSSLFDFIVFGWFFFNACLAGHCSIQQAELWQT